MRNPDLHLAIGLAAAVSGCGSSNNDASDIQDLTATKPSFVSVEQDLGTCAPPACGGFIVRDLNKTTQPKYVSHLDFSEAGLDEATENLVTSAEPAELVLRGRLGPIDPTTKQRAFLVSEAYRGLPGATVDEGDAYYQSTRLDPENVCVAAPCLNDVVSKVNLSTSAKVDLTVASKFARVGASFVDEAWLVGRMSAHHAIFAGIKSKTGAKTSVDVAQVFIRLPETIGPCAETPQPECATGEVAAATRSPDRCIEFAGCVEPGVCPQFIPQCDAGYELATWAALPDGCPAYACDPLFSLPSESPVVLHEGDDGDTVDAHVGQDIVVELDSNAPAGMDWDVSFSDEEFGNPMREFTPDENGQGHSGTGGIWYLGTTRLTWPTAGLPELVGEHHVELVYKRMDNTEPPTDRTFSFTVNVGE